MSKTSIDKNNLLAEAAEWRLISLLFECPKDDWFEEVSRLGSEVGDTDLRRAAEMAQNEASEGIFHSTFGPGGPAPGREVSYRGWVQPGYLLAEISDFYHAFAYQPANGEVPDHVSVEAGFIAYLKLKQAYSVECGDHEHAAITADAAREFIADHISKYAEKLSRHLAGSGFEYLEHASKALFTRVGPDPEREASRKIELPVLEVQDDPLFECGTAI